MIRFWILALLVSAASLLSATGEANNPIIQVSCSNPGGCAHLLERAIAAAPAGAVIQLSAGVFYENSLEITKSLTIRGQGKDRTLLISLKFIKPCTSRGYALLCIQSDSKIQVTLENLTIESTEVTVFAKGKTQLVIQNAVISGRRNYMDHFVYGGSLNAVESAWVRIEDSIVYTGTGGVLFGDQAVLELSKTYISGFLGFGVFAEGSVRMNLQDCQISGHDTGASVGGDAIVSIRNCHFTQAKSGGIGVGGNARLTLVKSIVSRNKLGGLGVGGAAVKVIVRESLIIENGTADECWRVENDRSICSGIKVATNAEVEITDSTIKDNADWGISVYREECGFYWAQNFFYFTGKVIFSGINKIEGNNKSGKQNGRGNPGNHPFKNLPDGQVCIP